MFPDCADGGLSRLVEPKDVKKTDLDADSRMRDLMIAAQLICAYHDNHSTPKS